jgi:hypothetical protein
MQERAENGFVFNYQNLFSRQWLRHDLSLADDN